jgi:hypothetical protein
VTRALIPLSPPDLVARQASRRSLFDGLNTPALASRVRSSVGLSTSRCAPRPPPSLVRRPQGPSASRQPPTQTCDPISRRLRATPRRSPNYPMPLREVCVLTRSAGSHGAGRNWLATQYHGKLPEQTIAIKCAADILQVPGYAGPEETPHCGQADGCRPLICLDKTEFAAVCSRHSGAIDIISAHFGRLGTVRLQVSYSNVAQPVFQRSSDAFSLLGRCRPSDIVSTRKSGLCCTSLLGRIEW